MSEIFCNVIYVYLFKYLLLFKYQNSYLENFTDVRNNSLQSENRFLSPYKKQHQI